MKAMPYIDEPLLARLTLGDVAACPTVDRNCCGLIQMPILLDIGAEMGMILILKSKSLFDFK